MNAYQKLLLTGFLSIVTLGVNAQSKDPEAPLYEAKKAFVANNPPSALAQAPTVFAPGVVSGPAHDAAPAFTPDGQTVYFSQSNAANSTILVAHRQASGWSAPEIASFSGQWNDLEPAMAPDGSFLIFVSNRPATGSGPALDGAYGGKTYPGHGANLWRIDRQGAGWGPAVRLPDAVNRTPNTFAPSVARDGSLYFMEPGGEKQRFHLLRAQYANGHFQPAEPLPFSDGSATDVDPVVAPDESFLVFGSGRAPAQDIDLFVVTRRNGQWQVPQHLGPTLNSRGSDAEPRLSPDGHTLYFSSERVLPVAFPRTPAAARADLSRLQSWDNGNYNVWQVPFRPPAP